MSVCGRGMCTKYKIKIKYITQTVRKKSTREISALIQTLRGTYIGIHGRPTTHHPDVYPHLVQV